MQATIPLQGQEPGYMYVLILLWWNEQVFFSSEYSLANVYSSVMGEKTYKKTENMLKGFFQYIK